MSRLLLVVFTLTWVSACGARLAPPSEAIRTVADAERAGVHLHDAATDSPTSFSSALEAFLEAGIVYVGEYHGTPEHPGLAAHLAQAAHASGRTVLIGVEMLPWTVQEAATAFSRGEIDERTFLERAGWEQNWGHDWEAYAPLFRLARQPGVELVALNAPRELTRTLFRHGMDALSEEARQLLPPVLDTSDGAHRRAVIGALEAHAGAHGGADPEIAERFYLAQVVWDETMAHRLHEAWQNAPEGRVAVVLAGGMHVRNGWGIPNRMERESGIRGLRILCRNAEDSELEGADPEMADLHCAPR